MSVYSVSTSPTHTFSKPPTTYIYLSPTAGVHSDAHSTASTSPRQVHLIASETLSSLSTKSQPFSPGDLGENITTSGVDLLHLSEGSRLHFGEHEGHAVVRITGVREPKGKGKWPGKLWERVGRGKGGKGVKIGVYGVVEEEGYVQAGYVVYVEKGRGGKLGAV